MSSLEGNDELAPEDQEQLDQEAAIWPWLETEELADREDYANNS
jgi:hypothetical protein